MKPGTAKMSEPRGGDFETEIASLETQFDILRYMRKVTELFGFRSFLICAVPAPEAVRLAPSSILSSLPADIMARYDSLSLVEFSSGIRRLRETTTPFALTLETWERESARAEGFADYIALLKENGVFQASYFPVHGPDGSRAAVIWFGPAALVPMLATMELQMISIHVYNRLSAIQAVWKTGSAALSEREVQCLSWTAAGKTSAEIASILGLSEHTVNHYLNHVAKKLDAVNRTQAVVKALKRGLIS
ncbi:helix-turn-helix transcriptional regulator [Ensifer soli]|uniref:helix-turn-helix transcriptional regulator n=1 Tax=Ciceribacter sp. sgz301302 TaxID=3342379 RepID=UPI0035B7469E